MSDHKEVDEHTGTETTGHEWDGIKELDTPLPRWWLYIFYATTVWAIVYWVFMPAWPAPPGMQGYTPGLRNHSERANVAVALADMQATRAEGYERLVGASYDEIEGDPDLFRFALAAGRSAFGDNCATCHGVGAEGARGYPNLNDDIWLWGGSFEDLRATIRYGIRSVHDQTRFSQMPAYGRDGLLDRRQIGDLADYVLSMSGHEVDAATRQRGAILYEQNCVSCHGADARGDRAQGAPDLTNADWLYGGTRDEIIHSIARGPFGVMPAFEGRMEDGMIAALATYVYALGGGEATPEGEPVMEIEAAEERQESAGG